jgi:hypothetical protein
MVKKKTKKKARKRLTPLQKIRKELGNLEALHAKEEAIVEKITEIIEEEEEKDIEIINENWEGTD